VTDSFYVNWTTQLHKGLLELAILNTLSSRSWPACAVPIFSA
jgi:hypothetical protein